MASNRIGRINEEIQRELAALLRTVKDPRVQRADHRSPTWTPRRISGTAKVYVSVLDQQDGKEVIRGLKSAGGYLRRELGRALSAAVYPRALVPGGRLH